MNIILSTVNQLAFLFLMIAVGFLLAKTGVLEQSAAGVLSKLEITVLIPALILQTFIERFRFETLRTAWQPFLWGMILLLVLIPPSILVARWCCAEREQRGIYLYGLCFSNFSFLGNALVSALFPDYFFEYLIFSLPLWIMVFAWATPFLLMPRVEHRSPKDWLKIFWNPLFLSIPIGMVLGLWELPLPSFVIQALDATASSMSPVAMLLTGICAAEVPFKKAFRERGIYLFSLVRLLLYPLAVLGILSIISLPQAVELAILIVSALPPGLNAIIIPAACGKNVEDAAGMTVLSHIYCCLTVPVMIWFYTLI